MSEPKIAQKAPYEIELEPGNYDWCACGNSKKQPLCDGSHEGTEFEPKSFQVDSKKKVFLCGCKRSRKAPFCDGSHKRI